MEEAEKENNVLKELAGNNQLIGIESVENSKMLRNDISDLKKNLKEKISNNEFYLNHYESIHKLQKFFRARYAKKTGKPKQNHNIQKLKLENVNLKKENLKLKAENKALILEMLIDYYS